MAKRNIMRIDLSASARREVGKLSERFGMTQLTVMSRLVDWFGQQSDELRSALCTDPESKAARDAIRRIFEQRVNKK